MQQQLNLSFPVSFAGFMSEPPFTVPTMEPNVAGSYQLPQPTNGGVPPFLFSNTPGKTPPSGWSVSPSGLLSWTAAAAQAAAGATVIVDWVSVSDSGS